MFNEYVRPDQGFDANTIDDAEPTDLWGFSGLNNIRQQVQLYRKATAALAP
jgi:hypothetical protein